MKKFLIRWAKVSTGLFVVPITLYYGLRTLNEWANAFGDRHQVLAPWFAGAFAAILLGLVVTGISFAPNDDDGGY